MSLTDSTLSRFIWHRIHIKNSQWSDLNLNYSNKRKSKNVGFTGTIKYCDQVLIPGIHDTIIILTVHEKVVTWLTIEEVLWLA